MLNPSAKLTHYLAAARFDTVTGINYTSAVCARRCSGFRDVVADVTPGPVSPSVISIVSAHPARRLPETETAPLAASPA